MNSNRFVINHIPRSDVINDIEMVVNNIVSGFRRFMMTDNGTVGFTLCEDFVFVRKLDDSSVRSSVLVAGNQKMSDSLRTRLDAIVNMPLSEVLTRINTTIDSKLFDTLMKNCSINRSRFLEQCYLKSHNHRPKMSAYLPSDKLLSTMEIVLLPKWLMIVVNESLDNLLELRIKDMLTITNDMVIEYVTNMFRDTGISVSASTRHFNIVKVPRTETCV